MIQMTNTIINSYFQINFTGNKVLSFQIHNLFATENQAYAISDALKALLKEDLAILATGSFKDVSELFFDALAPVFDIMSANNAEKFQEEVRLRNSLFAEKEGSVVPNAVGTHIIDAICSFARDAVKDGISISVESVLYKVDKTSHFCVLPE